MALHNQLKGFLKYAYIKFAFKANNKLHYIIATPALEQVVEQNAFLKRGQRINIFYLTWLLKPSIQLLL
ncbi:hypothetical protein D3C75_635110 [compost metagenome]